MAELQRAYEAQRRYGYSSVDIEEYLNGHCLRTVETGIKPCKLGERIADLMMEAYYQGRKDQAAEILLAEKHV